MMTTDQERKLDHLARQMGVRILPDLRGELHPEDIGGWFPRSRRVLYRLGMHYAETICAIAHELGHAANGDDYTPDKLRDVRQEARADRWAVNTLISKDAYQMAESLVGPHPGALSVELDVTVEYVVLWRKVNQPVLKT